MNSLFSKIFELLFHSASGINDDLYDFNLYGLSGIVMLVVSISFCVGFYFLFDKARFVGFMPWFLSLVVTFVTIMLITLFYSRSALVHEGKDYPFTDYLYFSIIVATYGAVIFFILSVIIKRFRTNLAHSPF
jgi:hypothetical protein